MHLSAEPPQQRAGLRALQRAEEFAGQDAVDARRRIRFPAVDVTLIDREAPVHKPAKGARLHQIFRLPSYGISKMST